MSRPYRSRRSWALVAVTIAAGALTSGACSQPPHGAFTVEPEARAPEAPPVAAPLDPLRAEMQLLAAAMRTAVDGVATGDLSGVEPALAAVHEAREATVHALEHGTLQAPRPQDPSLDADHFGRLDDAFHDELVALLTASRRQDVPAAIDALSRTLHGCQSCHELYRTPSVAPMAAPHQPTHGTHEH